MNTLLDKIAKRNNIKITNPFEICLNGNILIFECLIHNYGSRKGTIVDSDYEKIRPYTKQLIELGYTFSCFRINESGPDDDFSGMLSEWGEFK